MSDLIPKHGGYRKLKSFQIAQLCYDITVRFCDRYVDRFSRTKDQMVQAARSGVQNIAEGSQASATSKKTELKLTQVARASLEELKLDYEDFLRQRGLEVWSRENPLRQSLIDRRCVSADEVAKWIVEAVKVRGDGGAPGQSGRSGLGGQSVDFGCAGQAGRSGQCADSGCAGRSGQNGLSGQSSDSDKRGEATKKEPTLSTRSTRFTGSTKKESTKSTLSTGSMKKESTRSTVSPSTQLYPEFSANAALVLLAVACSLLDRQVERLAVDFEKDGGFSERLYRVRSEKRNGAR